MRLKNKFDELKKQNRSALVTYIMAYDQGKESSQELLNNLPSNGADIIELGMAFSDPMADGKTIQEASIRAINNGSKLSGILQMVEIFRKQDDKTPIILMGYYNPVQKYGLEKFVKDAKKVGVDGFLIVDLPPEEDNDLYQISKDADLSLIKLITPTSDDNRIKLIAEKASGFIYYVAVAGVTGTKSASYDSISSSVDKIKNHTSIPVAVGFGIKNAKDVSIVGKDADAVVVGSSLINALHDQGVGAALSFVKELSSGLQAK